MSAAAMNEFELYPKNRESSLDLQLFQHPTAEYRGTPFWSWNSRLDVTKLLHQLDCFKEMGLGGAHLHSRTGLATEYMGEDFLAAVRACAEHAQREKMLAWLYDEDRWPSGAAGGLVTRDPQYRARHLLFTPQPYRGQAGAAPDDSSAAAGRAENGQLLACYEVVLENGVLAGYRKLEKPEQARGEGVVWYAYLESAQPSSWFNNQTYVDTLSRPAIERFIEETHEKYLAAVGNYFGGVIPAIFTDEPQFVHKKTLTHATDMADICLPFTTDFLATYAAAYNQRLEEYLPELIWELPDGAASLARYRYHDHVSERFAAAFADTVGQWCARHGIALTGHLMEEPTLQSQTAALGEAMRSYRSFQLPGIDMLCDWREFNTAKQAQSAAHQYGCPGVLSELYGVTNWDFDFVGHKGQGDWQAALGVTVRVPHLAWVSMGGEAKRDYPAAIDYHSPWYREYRLIEDYFSRINTVLTRGRPVVRVGVIHPVESYWLAWGPAEQTRAERQEREEAFSNVTEWLLFGLVDFNFICESLLPSQCPGQDDQRFTVGEMAYDLVFVPNLRTIRATTLERLEAFATAGGKLVFAGEVPTLVDAMPSDRACRLAQQTATIPLTRRQVLAVVEDCREVEVKLGDGSPADAILYQMRQDGPDRHLFFCNTDRVGARDQVRIRLRGDWSITRLDAMTGAREPLASRLTANWTVLEWDFPAHGSLLLTLSPGWKRDGAVPAARELHEIGRLADPVSVTLSEPNVLLLDQAEWRLNEEPWQPLEEVLRIGNLARRRLGLKPITGHIAQPWTDHDDAPVLARFDLKYTIQSEVPIESPRLATEWSEQVEIKVDGRPLPVNVDGWWVDEAIRTVVLPTLAPGTHEIIMTVPLTRKTVFEWAYLLGDFGVNVQGRYSCLTAPVRSLAFGDWTVQGLPFYAGNVTYHCQLDGCDAGQSLVLEAAHFKGPLMSVSMHGELQGKIAFAPFRLDLGPVAGSQALDITVFGNRMNAFGAIHNADKQLLWYGPHAWRQTGKNWAYEYQLRQMGVLSAPIVYCAGAVD